MSRSEFLMAIRGQEAEPTVFEVGETEATLVLDDGERVTFDLVELRVALAGSDPAPAIPGGGSTR